MVFIDPVGTGYSRAGEARARARSSGACNGDIASVGEFIRLYLTRYERWGSPLFLVGESYGTTRAAGLSGYLVDRGIAFNGILLVSSILNFQTARFTRGNDLPYPLFLPTYTATAWYHKKLPADLQGKPLRAVLDEVEAFAGGEYPVALAKGDALPPADRKALAARLARYTGLDAGWIERADERIEIMHFCRELLAAERKNVGRIDSRFTGDNESGIAERPDFDPSIAAIVPPYTAAFNQYVRPDLGLKSDLTYYVLGRRDREPVGVPAERVRGHERRPARGVREEPVHAPLRRVRALRPRDAALRDALHALPHGPDRRTERAHHVEGVRGRAT